MKKRLEEFKKAVEEKLIFKVTDFIWGLYETELEIKIFYNLLLKGRVYKDTVIFLKEEKHNFDELKKYVELLERNAVQIYIILYNDNSRLGKVRNLEESIKSCFEKPEKLKLFDSKEELYDYCCHLVRNK